MELSKAFGSKEINYDLYTIMSPEEKELLPDETKNEICAEALFDYIRYKKAYGETTLVNDIEKIFNIIFDSLSNNDKHKVFVMAYSKINDMQIIN
jgi:hypothetical protein